MVRKYWIIITFVLIVLLVGLFIKLQEISTANYCKEKGFETGAYYPEIRGVYCWNYDKIKTYATSTNKLRIDQAFFPDKRPEQPIYSTPRSNTKRIGVMK